MVEGRLVVEHRGTAVVLLEARLGQHRAALVRQRRMRIQLATVGHVVGQHVILQERNRRRCISSKFQMGLCLIISYVTTGEPAFANDPRP